MFGGEQGVTGWKKRVCLEAPKRQACEEKFGQGCGWPSSFKWPPHSLRRSDTQAGLLPFSSQLLPLLLSACSQSCVAPSLTSRRVLLLSSAAFPPSPPFIKLCPFLTPPPPHCLALAPLLCHTRYHLSSDVFIRCLRFHLRPVPVHILDWKSSEGGPGPRVSHMSLFHCLDLTDLQ